MDPVLPIFIGVVVVLIVVSITFGAMADRRRRAAAEAFAQQRGLSFGPGAEPVEQLDLPELELMHKGRGRRKGPGLAGRIEGIDVAVFDYRYRTGSGKNSSTRRQTVIALGLPAQGEAAVKAQAFEAVPPFSIRREHFFDGISEFFGYRDVDFADRPEFSERFRLGVPGKSAADVSDAEVERLREAFNDRAIAFFTEGPGETWHVESRGRWLCVYEPGRKWPVEQWGDRLDESFDLLLRLTGAA